VAADQGRAAVIGSSGFIGGALAPALRVRGIATACFTRDSPFLSDDGTLHPDVASADTVYWLASTIRPATAEAESGRVGADHRALGSLLDALSPTSRQRIVAASSGGTIYDPTVPAPHSETSPVAPANAYGRAMLELETMLTQRAARSVVLRVSNAYGPGQQPKAGQGVIAHWMTAIKSGEPVHVLGSEDTARDYVFIEDVVDALIRVHAAPVPPPTIVNIGSGEPTSLRDLLRLVTEAVAPRSVDVRRDPARGFDAPSTWLDAGLAKTALGWSPSTALREGLRRTWISMTQQHPR
jgi:UDP-glucose 4-epimerase